MADPIAAPKTVKAAVPEATRRLVGSVLIVEDNMITVLEAEELLLSLGGQRGRHGLVDTRGAPPDRCRALPDVNLGSGTSVAVARRLFALGIPYAPATGSGDGFRILSDLAAVPMVQKPYGTVDLLRAFPC